MPDCQADNEKLRDEPVEDAMQVRGFRVWGF